MLTIPELRADPYNAIDWKAIPPPLPDDYFTMQEYAELVNHQPEVILDNEQLFRWGIENLFHIRNKQEQMQLLKQKEAQTRLLHTYFLLKKLGGKNEMGPQIVCLKSRQQGKTTWCSAKTMFELMLTPNRQALLIAHEKEKVAKKIFEIYTRFLVMLPEEFQIWNETKRRRADGWLLMNGSSIDVEVEKKGGVVGITTQDLHLSEAGRFKYLDDFLGGFIPGMPQLPNSRAIIESTAQKNEDTFHHIYRDAERGINRWFPVFFPWYIDEDNIKPFETEIEKEAFYRSLDIREDDAYGNEKELFDNYEDITLEHLHYRRERIDSFPNRLSQFKREYPTTPEEAFLGATTPVFDPFALRKYESEQVVEPEKFGRMKETQLGRIDAEHEFIEDSGGIIRLYGYPKEGHTYGFFSDHSWGKNDFNAGIMVQLYPLEIVGVMMGYEGNNPDARAYARQMFHYCSWYNNAWICPENNGPGQGVLDLLLEWEYGNIVSETSIFPEKTGFNYGWTNTVNTKEFGISLLQDRIKNMGVKIPSLDIIRQLEYFVAKTTPDGSRVTLQALRKGEHRSLGADINQFCDDLVFALISMEFGLKGIGKIKRPKQQLKEMQDEQGLWWVEEIVPQIEELIGTSTREHERPGSDWRDY